MPFLSQVRVKLQGFSRIVAPRYFFTILAEQYAVFPLLVADLEATDQTLFVNCDIAAGGRAGRACPGVGKGASKSDLPLLNIVFIFIDIVFRLCHGARRSACGRVSSVISR